MMMFVVFGLLWVLVKFTGALAENRYHQDLADTTGHVLTTAAAAAREDAIAQVRQNGVGTPVVIPAFSPVLGHCDQNGQDCDWSTVATVALSSPIPVQPGVDIQQTAEAMHLPTPTENDYNVTISAGTVGPDIHSTASPKPNVTLDTASRQYILRTYSVPPYAQLQDAPGPLATAAPGS